MNRDPFLRLALIVACMAAVAALVVFGIYFGAFRAAGIAALGILFAFAVTYTPPPPKPETDSRRRQRQPAEGTRGFERIE